MILFEIIFDVLGDLLLEILCFVLGAVFTAFVELFMPGAWTRGPQIQSLFADEAGNRAAQGGVR